MRLFETSTLISLLACNSFKALLLLTKRFNYCIFLLPYSPGKLIPPVSQNLLPTFNSFLLRQMAPTYGLKYFPLPSPQSASKAGGGGCGSAPDEVSRQTALRKEEEEEESCCKRQLLPPLDPSLGDVSCFQSSMILLTLPPSLPTQHGNLLLFPSSGWYNIH